MGKKVIMFAGQGSQCTGMAKESFDNCSKSRWCFEEASRITGIDMPKLVFEPNDLLDKTEYTQVALYTAQMAVFYEKMSAGMEYNAAIGLSLGEYGALSACGVIDYSEAVQLVRNRGIYMENAVPAGRGAMAAVIGMTADEVDKVLDATAQSLKRVTVANYNCPGQIVISGDKSEVTLALEYLKEAGARKCVMLNVSGPFHSPLLKGAGDKLGSDLHHITLNKAVYPYVANCTAEYVDNNTSPEYIKELLARQVYSPVYFEQSIRKLIKDGYDTFEEIGHSTTLSGFVRKIARDMKAEVNIIA